jgi:hypothetical protein
MAYLTAEDVGGMKVAALKAALEERSLDTKGAKKDLATRLLDALSGNGNLAGATVMAAAAATPATPAAAEASPAAAASGTPTVARARAAMARATSSAARAASSLRSRMADVRPGAWSPLPVLITPERGSGPSPIFTGRSSAATASAPAAPPVPPAHPPSRKALAWPATALLALLAALVSLHTARSVAGAPATRPVANATLVARIARCDLVG